MSAFGGKADMSKRLPAALVVLFGAISQRCWRALTVLVQRGPHLVSVAASRPKPLRELTENRVHWFYTNACIVPSRNVMKCDGRVGLSI